MIQIVFYFQLFLSANVRHREAPPERGTFFRLQVYERVGILLVEVFKRVGKSVIWVSEMAQRAEQMNFMTLYSRGNVLFLD